MNIQIHRWRWWWMGQDDTYEKKLCIQIYTRVWIYTTYEWIKIMDTHTQICLYTYMYLYIYVYIYVCIYIFIFIHMHIYIYIYIHVSYTYTYMYIFMYMYIHIHKYLYIIRISVHICIYVYKFIDTSTCVYDMPHFNLYTHVYFIILRGGFDQ